MCDLTDPALLKKLKLSKKQLTGDDWTETQALGEIVREIGFERMVVPSATGNFNNLVIFVDRISGASSIDLEDVEKLDLS